jgi:hypothetical protein
MNSSERLPYFNFYPADWLTDTSLRLCSPETRGVWIDLLCHMSVSSERGFLLINGHVLDTKGIQKLSGISPKKFKKVFEELFSFGIIKQDEKGRFYSKRMVNDERLRQVRREVGKKGGNPNLKKKVNHDVEGLVENLLNQTDNQNSTLSKSKSKVNKKQECFFNECEILNPLNDYIKKNCPNVSKLKQLSDSDAEKLMSEFKFEQITAVLDSMENYKPLLKKYSSVNLTLKNWLKNASHDKSNSNQSGRKPDFENALRNF